MNQALTWVFDRFFAVAGAVFVAMLIVSTWLDAYRCETGFDIETRYSIINGCQVQTEQGWIPADNWRAID